MGSGIAQVAASAGFETVVKEVSDDLIKKGFAGIEKSLAKFAEKGTITSDQQRDIRGRLSGHYFVRRPCGLRHHHRSHYREPGREAQHVSTVGRDLQTRNDLRFEYVVVVDH